ncbi:hypothetical protein HanRHA438_Chr09g0380261 [Helianthus annuus]|nr:hypothetical protein HanRHA438_Chr09g0380261 [Helianthus annuus]
MKIYISLSIAIYTQREQSNIIQIRLSFGHRNSINRPISSSPESDSPPPYSSRSGFQSVTGIITTVRTISSTAES